MTHQNFRERVDALQQRLDREARERAHETQLGEARRFLSGDLFPIPFSGLVGAGTYRTLAP
jgi:hypothetical protein